MGVGEGVVGVGEVGEGVVEGGEIGDGVGVEEVGGEKVEWGMIPFVQAMLMARFLRGDIDEYPPFFWK